MSKAINNKTVAAAETQGAAAAADGADNARPANTTAAYRSAWAAWQAWAEERGASALPAGPDTVAAYLAHRAAAGAKLATVRLAKAAIAAAHREAGADNPCASALVTRTVKGLARAAGNAAQKQAAALTGEALAAIRATATAPRRGRGGRLETADGATRRGLVDIALCVVMADGGLRRSEAAALLWGDVARAEGGSGRVTIRQSKPGGEGLDAVVAITARAMADLAAIRGAAADDAPVFGMSAAQISRRLKEAGKAAGLGTGFSGHSGRVGMARRMTSNGAPMAVTMHQGRWKSPRMVTRYTREEPESAALAYLC
ncbi:MAG: tyrosine-type recombinase/integrase [Candidatus Tectomicrobia bacterium]|nr:tyrosine-type recombinase/integrase [Candidatus Tectomicrobia bacterium]